MRNEETLNKLKEMRLTGMAEASKYNQKIKPLIIYPLKNGSIY